MDPKPAPAPAPATPRLVGRYALISKVVSGALGELFRARIASGPEVGRAVLVRLVERSASLDARSVERVTNAGFAAMELSHGKIAAVLDVAVGDSEIAVVSEHVRGVALSSLLKQPGPKRIPATTPIALRIVSDVLDALDALRGPWSEITADPSTDDERAIAGGLHGGLVPDDLLVSALGETMLLEPGLAGAAMTLPVISDHPEVVAYRAPEQLERAAAIDERADVFTIGVLAWELIAGRSLFGPMFVPKPSAPAAPGKPKPLSDQAQVGAARRKVLTAPIQRLDAMPLLKGKVTTEATAWVARCLERDPSARFSSLQEASKELRAFGASAIAGTEAVAKWIGSLGLELDIPAHGPLPDAKRPSISPTPPQETRHEAPALEKSGPVAPAVTAPPAVIQKPATASAVSPLAAPPPPLQQVAPSAVMPRSDATVANLVADAPPVSVPASTDAITIPPSTDIESIPPSAEMVSSMAESIPPSTDIESIPPSAEMVSSRAESIPPSTDIESIPPSARLVTSAGASVPPSTDVESIPPSSEDPATLPPGRPDITETASALSLQVKAAAFPRVAAKLDVLASSGEGPMSAPVVRPLPGAAQVDLDDYQPVRSSRPRKDSRKVVVYVMAGAGVLALVGVVRVLTSRSGSAGGSEKSEPSATAAAVASAPENARSAPAPVAPSPAEPPQNEAPRAAPPTSAPPRAPDSVPPPEHAPSPDVTTAKHSLPRRKAYRPTGI